MAERTELCWYRIALGVDNYFSFVVNRTNGAGKFFLIAVYVLLFLAALHYIDIDFVFYLLSIDRKILRVF